MQSAVYKIIKKINNTNGNITKNVLKIYKI